MASLYDLWVPRRLPTMVFSLLLFTSLMAPLRAPSLDEPRMAPALEPSSLDHCTLLAFIEGTTTPLFAFCEEEMICDDDVEMWNFAKYSKGNFTPFGPVPARAPDKIVVDMKDVKENEMSVSHLTLQWSLPPMSFDVTGFLAILRNYNNGSITSTCRMFKIAQNTTETHDNVAFVYNLTSLIQNTDYLLGLFSMPMPFTMPSEANKAWMIMNIRNNYPADAPLIGNWRPNVLVQRLPFPGDLRIQFSLSSEFSVYEIQALNSDMNDIKTYMHEVNDVNLTQTFYVMNRVYKGTYQIMVRPYNDPNNCMCVEDINAENKTCLETCPETVTMKFAMNDDEPMPDTSTALFTGTVQQITFLDTTTVNPNDILTPEATRNQADDFVLTTTTGDPLNLMPTTIQRTNNSLIGGLIGGLVAAGLFSFIVVVFAVLDKPPPPRKSKVSAN